MSTNRTSLAAHRNRRNRRTVPETLHKGTHLATIIRRTRHSSGRRADSPLPGPLSTLARRFRSRAAMLVALVVMVFGVGVATSPAASAAPGDYHMIWTPEGYVFVTEGTDSGMTYHGRYWVLSHWDNQWHLADAYRGMYAQATYYCWVSNGACWWEVDPWLVD